MSPNLPPIAPYVRKQILRGAKLQLGLGVVAFAIGAVLLLDLAMGHRASFGRHGGGLALAALGTYWSVSAIRALLRPEADPMLRDLARHGELAEVTDAIARIASGSEGHRFCNLVITDEWLVVPGMDLKAMHVSDIAWAYELQTTVKVNSVAVGGFRDLVVRAEIGRFAGKTPFKIALMAKEIAPALARIAEMAPRAHRGYDERADAMWTKDPQAALDLLRGRSTTSMYR